MSESAIARYLDQLERELRTKRAPRRRLLAEAADHLRASAEEIAAGGVDAGAAEAEAVARFGAAAAVAHRFAHVLATNAARTALVGAAAACGSYAIAAAVFVLTAPSWLHDFPQGAPSMLALQVAAVALALTGVRAFRSRKALLIDEMRLRLVASGACIATGAVVAAAGAELALALTRPAPAPWRDAVAVIVLYAVAAVATVAAAAVAVAAAARAGVLRVLPRPPFRDVSPTMAALVDDVAAVAPRLRPLAIPLTSRPALTCAATAALGFAAITVIAVVDDSSGLAGAAATGVFEAAAIVIAYLTLGRALGLRAPRRAA